MIGEVDEEEVDKVELPTLIGRDPLRLSSPG